MKDKSAGEETRRPVRHQVGERERERLIRRGHAAVI